MQKADLRQKLKETMAKRETVTEDMIQALTPECYEELLLTIDSRLFVLLEDFYMNSYSLEELSDMWNEASMSAYYTADDIAYIINRFEAGLEAMLRSKAMFQKMKTFAKKHDHMLSQNNPPTMR